MASCSIAVSSSNDNIANAVIPCDLNLFKFSRIVSLIFFVNFLSVWAFELDILIFNVSLFAVVDGSVSVIVAGFVVFVDSCLESIFSCICFFMSSSGNVKITECSSCRSCGSLYSIHKKSNMCFSVLNNKFWIFSCFTFVVCVTL